MSWPWRRVQARKTARAAPKRLAGFAGMAASCPRAMATLLSAETVAELPQTVPGWQVQAGRLHRELRFADFVAAFGFMAQVALVAEALGHHPDWSNSWNRVVIDLTSHDLGGLCDLDLELAQRINQILQASPSPARP